MKRADLTSTNWSLWFAFVAGPVAWTLHELVSYALVRPACGMGFGFMLHLVSVACLGLAGAGAYVALRAHGPRLAPAASAADVLAGTGVLMNALFGFAILMETLPNVVVSPCL